MIKYDVISLYRALQLRRDRPIIVELCDALNPYDTNAVWALHFIREVNLAERIEKITYDTLRNAIELVNEEHNPFESTRFLMSIAV